MTFLITYTNDTTEIKLLTDPVDYELYEDTGDHGEEVRYANFEHEQILNTASTP